MPSSPFLDEIFVWGMNSQGAENMWLSVVV